MTGPTKVITVPITDAHGAEPLRAGRSRRRGGAHATTRAIRIRSCRSVRRTRSGRSTCRCRRSSARSTVTVSPSVPRRSGPGESAKLAVEVRDAAGKPVAGAEVAVIVVDEAILALTGYQFPNPIDAFYGERGPRRARPLLCARYVKLAKPDRRRRSPAKRSAGRRQRRCDGGCPRHGAAAAHGARRRWRPSRATEAAPRSAMPSRRTSAKNAATTRQAEAAADGRSPSIAIRSNFNPLAAFAPAVRTDAQRQGDRRDQDARQPDALPDRRGRGGRRQAVRQGRECDHRAPAADGAAEPAAVPELRRHVRAAGRGAEPDRRADDGEARGARDER